MALAGPWDCPSYAADRAREVLVNDLDRTKFLVGAQPDSDEEEESDRMSDEVKDDQDGLKGKKDEDDLDELDEVDSEAKDDEEKDERDTDLDEEEETFKKRYGDLRADRDEKVRQLRELMTENAKLKAIQTTNSDVDEEALAREIQEGIFKEVSQINETDPAKARKAAYDVVGKHIALSTKKAVELALKKVATQQQEQASQTDEQKKQMEVAKRRARIALKEVGLDDAKHYKDFEDAVTKQMEQDPEWFETIPASEHYIRIATRVKKRIERIKQERAEHQREAGGLTAGTRIPKRPTRTDDEGDDKEPDTMTGAMQLLGRRNLSRGNRAFQLAHLQRK